MISLAWGGYRETTEEREAFAAIFEPKRSLLVRSGGQACATIAVYSLRMTLPGGPQPVAGLSCAAVSPEHRRGGLLRRMMHRVFNDLHDSTAEPVAAMCTSEAGIFGRFGCGLASQTLRLTIPRSNRAVERHQADSGLRVRIAEPEECIQVIRDVDGANWLDRPGMIRRDGAWTRMAILDSPERREGTARLLCLLVEGDSGVRGYALYATSSHWEHSCPRFVVTIRELFAKDPASYVRLWTVLLDLDLSDMVVADARPIDDPVLTLLTDPRSAAPVVRDQLYVRLIDVERALACRGYASDIDLVLDVADPICPWNEGRWRLRAGDRGAECKRTTSDADLALSVRELGAVFLGGGSLLQLARAGRVVEVHPGSLRIAAAAFRNDPAPFCQIAF